MNLLVKKTFCLALWALASFLIPIFISGRAMAQAPQGSFPGVCQIIKTLRQHIQDTRDLHLSYRQYFNMKSDLYRYVRDFPKELKSGVGKHTFEQVRDIPAVYTVLGSVSYMDRAKHCASSLQAFRDANLQRMDELLLKLSTSHSLFLFEDIFNIRISIENAKNLHVQITELLGRIENIHAKVFKPQDSNRSIFEPCHTFEAAVDIFFKPLVPELVKRWNRYENPASFDLFRGGREAQDAIDDSEIAKLRYKIWLATGAAWTLEQQTQAQLALYQAMKYKLERYIWEAQIFKYKSRYDAFYCRK